MVDSCHQLPSLVHGEGRTASSGPFESRRRTNNQGEQTAGGRGKHNRISTLRRSNQCMRTMELVDKAGNRTCKIQEGRMCTTSHSSVLAAL
jgi:hypothetical protein